MRRRPLVRPRIEKLQQRNRRHERRRRGGGGCQKGDRRGIRRRSLYRRAAHRRRTARAYHDLTDNAEALASLGCMRDTQRARDKSFKEHMKDKCLEKRFAPLFVERRVEVAAGVKAEF